VGQDLDFVLDVGVLVSNSKHGVCLG